MKIKTSLIYSIAAGTLLCAGSANAQSATPPVGFHTLTVFGANADGSARFSLLAPGLINAIEFAGASTSITADTVTVDGTPFETLDFGPTDNGGTTAYYVEVTDGDEEGAWASITANTDNTLTVNRDLSAAGAAKIAIRKHVTLGDLFGAANEAGLQSADNLAAADEVTLFVPNSDALIFFYFDNGAGAEGWADSGGSLAVNTPIEPQQAVYVKRKTAGDVSFTRSGHVKTGATKLNIEQGFNTVANPRAVGRDDDSNPVFTLGNSNLQNDTANSVDSADNIGAADEVVTFEDSGDFGVFFHFDNGAVQGWSTAGGDLSDDFVLENGKGFIVNRKTGAPFIWTVPAETIAE